MALMLMGRLILSVNTTTLDVGYAKDMAEYRIIGTSLGTSMIEQSNALAYDETTVDTNVTATSMLTLASSFGPDGLENASSFDDIDDFHNFTKYDTLQSVVYKSRVLVTYLNVTSTAITPTTTRSYNKQITVEVTSDYLVDYTLNPPKPDTLRFRTVFSYWFFR
ncbi:MAG: hypothetical protein F9K22_01905 [Bacteroidetes bacterium]|nr:MAG: hypothetical protein F9K22_01905 [Bacteroidota bacterium]